MLVTNLEHHAHHSCAADMLSADEERRLVCAWQKFGDRRSRDRLINAFAPMAASVAKRAKPRSKGVDPDLVQQANIGLMKAADRFDPERENRFSAYAIWWARAEVQTYIWANKSVVRRPNSPQSRKAAAHVAVLNAEMTTDPGIDSSEVDAKLADKLGVNADRAATLRAQVTGSDHSLNAPALGDDGEDRIALLVDPASLEEPAPLRRLETLALRRVLVEALSILPDRERSIIVATLVRDPPATLETLGARYGVSKQRARQLRERGIERLRAALQRRGLTLESLIL